MLGISVLPFMEVIFIFFSAVFGFKLGYGRDIEPEPKKHNKLNALYLSNILIFLGASVLLIYFREFISSIGNYWEANRINHMYPIYSFGQYIFLIGLTIKLSSSLAMGGKKVYLIGAIMILYFLMLQDKNVLLLMGIVISKRIKESLSGLSLIAKIILLPLVVSFCIFALVSVRAFSYSRAGVSIINSYELAAQGFALSQLDFGGPYETIIGEYSTEQYSLGTTYHKDLIILVPRFIWPSRPLSISEEYSKENVPNWQPGQGLGYSNIAEGIRNFGVWFIWLHFLFLGFMLKMFHRLSIFCLRLFRANRGDEHIVVFPIIGYLLVLTFRSSTLSFVKPLIMFSVVLLFTSLLLSVFWAVKKYI